MLDVRSEAKRQAAVHKKSLPNRYPIAKKTKITTATITATIAIMLRTEGVSSFTASPPWRRLAAAGPR
jgi:hypothetical protein